MWGARVSLPNHSPTSEMTSRTPLGTAMKRMPTTAKVTREQAQVEDDETLCRGPLHRRDNNWLSSQGAQRRVPPRIRR